MVKKGAVSNRKRRKEDEVLIDKMMEENQESSDKEDIIEDSDQLDSENEENISGHKKSLHNLKDTDPDFYKFLEDNDEELLQFSDESDDEDETKNEKFHKAPDKLEVASDDSDASDDDDGQRSDLISVGQINKWKKQLQDLPTIPLIRNIVRAFESAVTQASGTSVPHDEKIHVRGSPAFNAIMKVCMFDMQPALHKVMKLSAQKKEIDPKKSKFWIKLKKTIKIYLSNVNKIMAVVSDSSILSVVLKHVHQMVPFFMTIPTIAKQLLKNLIKLWSTAEETVRVLAFLCIMVVCRKHHGVLLDNMLKQMYMSYVKNCKFTSPTTWPLINFMKHSLVEVYALDEVLAYQHAFVYIRQLAIHLRNAITLKKKDSIQSVYNWQYIHCILLWTHLLGSVASSETLKPLIYPLVQTIMGTIKLIPTQKYLPMRFHCIGALTMLSDKTNTFIPILPFIIEVLDMIDLNKHHTNVSFKPMDFSCSLKLTKKQLSENGFKDRAIDQIYESVMEYLNSQAFKIGYPELVLPATLKLKSFTKNCKNANYNKQLKQLMDKVIENGVFVSDQRNKFTSSISDTSAVDLWERQIKESGTPLTKFYVSWRKMKNVEIAHSIAKKSKVEDHKLPEMPKHKKVSEKKLVKRRKSGELFSDSDDDSDVDISKYLTESNAQEIEKEME